MADNTDIELFERTIVVSVPGSTEVEPLDLSELPPSPDDVDNLTDDEPPPFPTVDLVEDSSTPAALSPIDSCSNGNSLQSSRPIPTRQPQTADQAIANKKRKTSPAIPLFRRVVFNREMTAQIMLWFDDCRKRGLFNSTKKKDYGPIWQEVLENCRERWPRYPWKTQIISSKYDTERRRYQQWKMLVDGYSGVTFDYTTGLPCVSESTWEQFVKRNNTNSKSVLWLRDIPLGDVEVYRSVFWRERASGSYIAEVDDVVDTQSTDVVDVDLDDSVCDNVDILDTEFEDNSSNNIATETPVPKRRRLTSAQQHRLRTDPDHTPSRDSISTVDIPVYQTSYRRPERDSTIIANSLKETVGALAAPRLAGANDLATTVEDI
ncbi:hypothetical protein VTI28DRAFT_1710 [Corynascus sepedonium]